jgi:hypothetical protein
MIRDVVIHLNGEQPLRADIYEAPSPGDIGLRCTNLRQMNGKRPVFIDDMRSIFFFPYLNIRFVEILPGTITGGDPSLALSADGHYLDGTPIEPAEAEPDLEIDEDFLRRIREV